MHPAKSVIFFTTASGAGYGLFTVAAFLALAGRLPAALPDTLAIWAAGLGLVTAGLLASTFHLGHPERAWRALSQWRSSWLSREGVAALWTYLPLAAWGLLRLVDPAAAGGTLDRTLAAVSGLSCLVTLYCTAMIYASLRPVPAWSNAWTPAVYLVLGPMTGAVLLAAVESALGRPDPVLSTLAIALLIAGAGVKLGYWRRIDAAPARSTAGTATGLGSRVTLFEAPHTGSNYLMNEMGFRIARKHRDRLRRIVLLAGMVLPAAVLAAALAGAPALTMTVVAVIGAGIGVVCERFLFFAEAKHAQTLYYGEAEV